MFTDKILQNIDYYFTNLHSNYVISLNKLNKLIKNKNCISNELPHTINKTRCNTNHDIEDIECIEGSKKCYNRWQNAKK